MEAGDGLVQTLETGQSEVRIFFVCLSLSACRMTCRMTHSVNAWTYHFYADWIARATRLKSSFLVLSISDDSARYSGYSDKQEFAGVLFLATRDWLLLSFKFSKSSFKICHTHAANLIPQLQNFRNGSCIVKLSGINPK